jgi:hypothetical protein
MTNQLTFICHPGWVKSQHDNDEHYLSAAKVANLYGLSLSDPNVKLVNPDDKVFHIRPASYEINLWPQPNGDYNLQTRITEQLTEHFRK